MGGGVEGGCSRREGTRSSKRRRTGGAEVEVKVHDAEEQDVHVQGSRWLKW